MEQHSVPDLPAAPQWGVFLGQYGKFSVGLTLVGCIVAVVLSIFFPEKFTVIRRSAFYIACVGFVSVFVTLAALFLTNQFQFEYIFNHSAAENPVGYKIASIWTAQQGSFLLWALYAAILGGITLRRTESYERWYTATYAAFLGVLAGILFCDSPFNLLKDVVQAGKVMMPPNGNGMPPPLQNYWVIIHPPIIFLGFATLTVPFAYGFAAMLTGNVKDWVKQCRAPALVGVSVLGLGISLGGLWAYETQGWGGFWGWDPVENVSLVPWLFLVALSHGLIVQNVRGKWSLGNLFMSGVPFLSFVYGTFLTRSGLLDKVSNHSFASMEGGALLILRIFLWTSILGFIAVFIWRARRLSIDKDNQEADKAGFNRESFYLFGSLSLSLMSFVIALGMSWPVMTAKFSTGPVKAVDAGVYHKAIIWFFVAVMVAMAVGPYVSWKRAGLGSILNRFVTMISLALGAAGLFLLLPKYTSIGIQIEPGTMVNGLLPGSHISLPLVIAFLLFLCFFAAFTNLWRAIELSKVSKLGIGPFVAHLGIAVLLSGLIISKGLEREEQTLVSNGEPGTALGNKIEFKSWDTERMTDRSNVVNFTVTTPDGGTHIISPNMYFYGSNTAQSWPYIERALGHDMYYFMQKPEVEIWATPMNIKPGEKLVNDDIAVKYNDFTMTGQPGKMGTQFGANMEVTYTNKKTGDSQTFKVHPTLTMTEHGLEPSYEMVGNLFRVGLLPTMDVAAKSFTVQTYFKSPVFPFQVFYKPLTSLVYVGTAIFTIGGFIAAFYRRLKRKSPEGDFVANSAKIDSKK
jgi:cytochrome c-type biogenesis protein CcmF